MKNLVEFNSFEEAWNAAINTKESFAAFQTGSKIKIMKEYAIRFFVDENKEFHYVSQSKDGLRIFKKAEVFSMIHNGGFNLAVIGHEISKVIVSFTREQAVDICNRKPDVIFTH